jgi:uncharacterized protein with beta-barrel porin domain
VTPSAAASTNVSGTASLTGTAQASFAPGSYMTRNYTILHSAGLGGTTFNALTTTNLPSGFDASLIYTSTDVLLNLTGALGSSGLNVNQQNVANGLNGFFNNGGTLPPNFVNIFGLSGGNLASALSQLSGEPATGAERAAFQLTNEFLQLMLDPDVDGRGGGTAMPLAPERLADFPPDVALAYASVFKAPPKPPADRSWNVWAAGFGGGNRANGDPVVGSANVTAATFGYAAGIDYRVSPDTVVGFALAGAGTNWGLAQGLGGGRSDAFQAGVYGKTHWGPAYLAAAFAFSNNWFTTNRTALAGDLLSASFSGQSYGGRLEAGWRYAATPMIGVTPYAALQAQSFHTPSYSESDLSGGGFGLTYNAMNGTDTRSELGARFDDPTLLGTMPLILRARLAWAHDWVSNPALGAVFQALPGASFIVNGAPIPQNSALASAGAELHMTPSWSFAARFDGEFASGSDTYAGTGTVRYRW